MPRELDNDFKILWDFVNNYDFSSSLGQEHYRLRLKQAHKSYFILLTLWTVIRFELSKSPIRMHNGVELHATSIHHSLILEAVSDYGSGIFCCLNGAYKPAHMCLRSSIENYVRALTGLYDASAITNKKVYSLFDQAKASPAFSGTRSKTLNTLLTIYGELCNYSHSSTLKHMIGVESLNHFPKYNDQAFDEWGIHSTKVMKSFVTSFLGLAPYIYLQAHFRTKEILDLGFMSSEERIAILGG